MDVLQMNGLAVEHRRTRTECNAGSSTGLAACRFRAAGSRLNEPRRSFFHTCKFCETCGSWQQCLLPSYECFEGLKGPESMKQPWPGGNLEDDTV